MRDTFVRTIIDIAKNDRNVCLITGDLGFGVLKPYWEALPEQFINAGIAEQNMTGVATGMALEGKTVITYSIGNFPTLRCLEQIRNDAAYHNANVKIVCVGGGFCYGALGMSHHATEDLAVMRALPNMTVFAPADQAEAEAATRAMSKTNGPFYLRLGRGGEKRVHSRLDDFRIGRAIRIHDGEDVVLFSTGAIIDEVEEARELLMEAGIRPAVYTFPTVKPIDRETIEACGREYDLMVTVEEHNIVGGFGSAVAEVLAETADRRCRISRVGLRDAYSGIVGSQKYLRNEFGMSARAICQTVKESFDESHIALGQ